MDQSDNINLFEELFYKGFRSLKMKSEAFTCERGRFELISDALAGPLYHIYTYGNCDYVFSGKHKSFPNIRTSNDFLEWCLSIVKIFRDGINGMEANGIDEQADREMLTESASLMEELSYLAYEIVKDRRRE